MGRWLLLGVAAALQRDAATALDAATLDADSLGAGCAEPDGLAGVPFRTVATCLFEHYQDPSYRRIPPIFMPDAAREALDHCSKMLRENGAAAANLRGLYHFSFNCKGGNYGGWKEVYDKLQADRALLQKELDASKPNTIYQAEKASGLDASLLAAGYMKTLHKVHAGGVVGAEGTEPGAWTRRLASAKVWLSNVVVPDLGRRSTDSWTTERLMAELAKYGRPSGGGSWTTAQIAEVLAALEQEEWPRCPVLK